MNPGETVAVMAGYACKMCYFEKTELRHRIIANGTSQIVFQCLQCGRSATNPLPKSAVPNYRKLPAWDESIAKAWDRTKHAAHVQEKQENRAEFFKEHDEYLKSLDWKKRRFLVMKRAGNMCEGCREAPATEVHHLTYENWKEEFLWELVAICHDCHERLHIAKSKAAAANAWQPE